MVCSREEATERRPCTTAAEDHVQSGTDAQPGNGVQEQRVRVPEQEIGTGQRVGFIRNAGEDLVSKSQGQGQEAGKDPLRPADQVRNVVLYINRKRGTMALKYYCSQ